MGNELEVPEAALDLLGRISGRTHGPADYVREIARHVVAAELHRLAGSGWARPADLTARANELEAQ